LHWIDYESPHSIKDAVDLLNGSGGARPIAGGTDVLVQLRAGAMPGVNLLVDVKNIPEMNELNYDAGSGLTIGAAVPCYKIYGDDAIAKAYPGLIDSASLIGGTQIQGRASLGGNLCNAAPSADSVPVMIALGGIARIAGPNGEREVPLEDFCVGVRQTVIQQGEILTAIYFPAPVSNSGANYMRFIPRNEMDIAVAGVGSSVVLENGNIKSAKVALSSVAPIPLYVKEIGEALAGKPANDDSLEQAGLLAKNAAKPITDMRGTVEYRKHLCDVLTRRSLKISIDRAKEA